VVGAAVDNQARQLADFLSKPILVGFLNGVAISIFLGQIGKVLGFSVESSGIIPRLLEVLGKVPLIHGATLAWPNMAIEVDITAMLAR
jgi:MFS superfamily sulfate permease-like transporter